MFLSRCRYFLAPEKPFRTAVFAGVPFAFGLDTSAVEELSQRASAAMIGEDHIQLSLAAEQSAEIRHRSVKAGKLKQA